MPTPRPKRKLIILEDNPQKELESEEEEDAPIVSLIQKKRQTPEGLSEGPIGAITTMKLSPSK